MNFYSKKAQNGYLLDEYTFLGEKMSWQKFARLQERYVHSDGITEDQVRSINLAKWIQEKQRAREQMEEMYEEQCFALDNIFFGKEIHRPFI